MHESLKSENWAIVGGGLLGMTLALRLAEAGKRVTLYEGADHLGGLASAWNLGEVVWDKHYHVTLLSDTSLRALLDELGLEKEMRWVETRTGFYTDGKLVSMSNTLEFLRFPPLGLMGKLRLGGTIFYASRVKDWKRLEKIPVAEWLAKLSGRRTFEKIWLPLLRAKLGESYQKASAAFIWATIARMYAARRTGLKKEMFGYVPGGYARILKRFGEVLEEKGVEIKLGCAVKKVETEESGALSLEFEEGKRETFDEVVLTVPGAVAAHVCAELTDEEKAKLDGVQYQGIICASLLLKKPLANFYVTNITDSFVPFTAVIEMSALVDRAQFGGHALVYLPKYVAPDDPAFALSDEEIKESFLNAIARMYPDFEKTDVVSFRVSRVRYVFPIPTLNYSEKLPAMQTSIGGLHVINSAHIVNGTLNVNETVQLAEKSAARLLSLPERFVSKPESLKVVKEYEDEAICQPVSGPR
jgi:protoporphyrinogen oxidase